MIRESHWQVLKNGMLNVFTKVSEDNLHVTLDEMTLGNG
jgi:hypothetical protein